MFSNDEVSEVSTDPVIGDSPKGMNSRLKHPFENYNPFAPFIKYLSKDLAQTNIPYMEHMGHVFSSLD